MAVCSIVILASAAAAAPPSKPKSQQDMMKMLDDYERSTPQGGARAGGPGMSQPAMGRGYGGAQGMMRRPGMPGMRGGMPIGGGYMGRSMQPRPVGNSNAALLQSLKQKFERMNQNQPAMMQMMQGQMQGAHGGAGMGAGMGGGGFMQMLQQKMQQAPPGGQMQKFGQSMPGMTPPTMRSPQPGGGMGQFGAPTMTQGPGTVASPPAGPFKRLGQQHSGPAPSAGSMQDLESQMDAQYGK